MVGSELRISVVLPGAAGNCYVADVMECGERGEETGHEVTVT